MLKAAVSQGFRMLLDASSVSTYDASVCEDTPTACGRAPVYHSDDLSINEGGKDQRQGVLPLGNGRECCIGDDLSTLIEVPKIAQMKTSAPERPSGEQPLLLSVTLLNVLTAFF
eukprot:m.2006 g.2006  ORF g.2006 m.2006 type:complete len:114 (+) comp8167_c0_seq1:258-599(+)